MSSEERRKILQMVEEGKISAELAASLMRALEADAAGGEIEVIEPEPGSSASSIPEFEEVKARARNLALIPLWTGIVIAVLSAWGMYGIQQNFGMNFWFYLLLFPLFLRSPLFH